MPATAPLGLPYPAPSDAGDVPYWMQQLAEAVQARIVADDTNHLSGTGGVHTATTDATTGRTTITHGLGYIPAWVTLTPSWTGNQTVSRLQKPSIYALTANTITVQWYRTDSNVEFVGNPVACYWAAGKA